MKKPKQPQVVAIVVQPGQTLTVTATGAVSVDPMRPWAGWVGGAGDILDKKLEERKNRDSARQRAFKVGRYIEKKWKIVPTSKAIVELTQLLA